MPNSAKAHLQRLAGRLALAFLVPAATLSMIAAVAFSNLPGDLFPKIAAAAVFVAVLAILALFESLGRAVGVIAALFAVISLWWLLIPASNNRDWQPQVAILPTAEFSGDGNTVTVKNIRNFDYRSRNDFDVRYYDKTFALDELRGTDFFVSYWGNEAIAHTFLSFRFKNTSPLALSIEIRPESGESYHPLRGIFKQYEIIYVLGDERDLVRLRTNYRGEDVYLYRGAGSPKHARALFVDILERVNALAEQPAFYGTIGANCTTSLVKHVNNTLEDKIPFSGAVLFNGFSDKLVYNRGNIDTGSLSFLQLKAASHISSIAKTLDADPEFSAKIREHIANNISAIKNL